MHVSLAFLICHDLFHGSYIIGSDSNLLAMQVFITVEEVTDGGTTGRACDDNNPHSLQLRWNLPSRLGHTGGGSRIL